MPVEIPKQLVEKLVEIYTHNTSTKRGSNLVPFDKISKSGDGGRVVEVYPHNIMQLHTIMNRCLQ